MKSDGRGLCNCCGGVISLDDKANPYISKNNVPLDRGHIVLGIISILGSIGYFIFIMRNELGLAFAGITYLIAPITGLIHHELFYRSDRFFQDLGDLHRALISGRIKYYDFGSKFLVYSLLGIQLTGIFLILIEIIT